MLTKLTITRGYIGEGCGVADEGCDATEEPDEALNPEIIGRGNNQRNVGPGGRRIEKRNTAHFARQAERAAAQRIKDDPESAKDPGFDPDLPPKRATGWAD